MVFVHFLAIYQCRQVWAICSPNASLELRSRLSGMLGVKLVENPETYLGLGMDLMQKKSNLFSRVFTWVGKKEEEEEEESYKDGKQNH